ncbi:hypothetical protein FSHL1_002792 [Fusarium sambucinum]
MMGAIYEGAKNVIVWLGLDTDNTPSVKSIITFGTNLDIHWDPAKTPSYNKEDKYSVLKITLWLMNQWYTRIWTLQEAALARSLVYRCGSFTIQEREMDGFINSFIRHFFGEQCCNMRNLDMKHGIAGLDMEIHSWAVRMRNMVKLKNTKGPSNFLEIASKFRHRLATNPRDKVFGVLGLTTDLPKTIVDYTPSVVETFSKVVFEHITRTGTLDILSHTLPKPNDRTDNTPTERSEIFPSWVPDWSDSRKKENWRLPGLSERQSFTHIFHACSLGSTPCPRRISPDQLELKGIFCDKIVELGAPMHFNILGCDLEVFKNWRQMTNVDKDPERPYIAGTTTLDAYFRTLCMDIDPSKFSSDTPTTDTTAIKADITTRGLHDKWWWNVLLFLEYPGESKGPGAKMLQTPLFQKYSSHFAIVASGRKMFLTEKGYLGLASDEAHKGDEIWILDGGRLPLVLRRHDTQAPGTVSSKYTFIGDGYVQGIMGGEFAEKALEDGVMPTSVILV